MNLEDFDSVTLSEQGVEYALRDLRTGQPTDAVLLLAGPDSPIYRQAEQDAIRMQTRRIREEGNEAVLTMTDEELVALLSPCILDWRGIRERGEELAYSHDAAKRLLEKYPTIRRQVNVFVGDAKHFLRDVEKNLQSSGAGVSV